MSYPVFYASEPELKSGLSEEESFHACRVLRLKNGDQIHILDGKGKRFEAELEFVVMATLAALGEIEITLNSGKSINSTSELKRSISKFGNSSKVKLIDGQIISRNISDWNNKASINLGSNNGIKVGNAVLYDGILFGFVEKVEKNTSLVKLTTSENIRLSIPAMAYKDNKEFNGIMLNYDADENVYRFKTYSNQKRPWKLTPPVFKWFIN